MRWLPTASALVVLSVLSGCGEPTEPLGSAAQAIEAADTPIFITHGLAAWPFDDSLKPYLEAQGYRVFMPEVSPFGPVRYRAEELRTQIDASLDEVGAERGVIIAHSMGGVDARWLLSPDGLDYDRIAALVTVASPHRGTAIADTVVNGVPFFLQNRVDRLLKALGMTPDEAEALEGLVDLTTTEMSVFNEQVRDDPEVEYYSYSSQQRPSQGLNPLLYVSYYIIKSKDGANDGIASVEGAKWGHYLGDLNADHADHVGGLGLKTKFDFTGLYQGAIEAAFTNYNEGTYEPTYSIPAPAEHPFPQSQHEYWNNLSASEGVQISGAAGLKMTFDPLTSVESGYDFIHIEDASGAPIAGSPFTGSALAGQTVVVPGDIANIRLESDFSVTAWGYRVTNVEAQ